jgi:NADH:ubiquinone oxidoreductase subunit 6 (subunit J)
MILEALTIGLVISACLAIFIDEAVYSIVALAGTFFLTSTLYAFNGAVFVAVFQFAIGVGTLAILFLSGEMLGGRMEKKPPRKNVLIVLLSGAVLSLPAVFLSIFGTTNSVPPIPFGETLWNLRAADVVLQGLVVFGVALGIGIVLYEKKRKGEL